MASLELILFKRFTSGDFKDLTYTETLKVKTIKDLEWLDFIGKEIDAYCSSSYKIDNVYVYDRETDNYLTPKQAELRMRGF